jgi:hypothetical protein
MFDVRPVEIGKLEDDEILGGRDAQTALDESAPDRFSLKRRLGGLHFERQSTVA